MKKMKFPKDMFYTDMNNPLYRKGEVYEVEDRMVERWLKRGGIVVEELPVVEKAVEPVVEKTQDKAKAEPAPKVYTKTNKRK
jgi:hypothetical protein